MGPFLKQTWTVSGVLMHLVGHGMAFGFPSSLMPALMAKDAEIPADLNMASWIASSIGIGGFPGIFLSSYCMDRFGRRISYILITIPGCIGWLFIYFATDTTRLVIGRLLCGFSPGATMGLGAVVIGEYTSPKHRGMFLNLKSAFFCIGGMLVHILGNYCNWRTVALISIVPYIATLLIAATWPESPAWLAQKGEFEESEKIFFWLRGNDKDSKEEIKKMIYVQKENAKHLKETSFVQKIRNFVKKFTQKDFVKPVFIIFMGTSLFEVSGRHIFPAYALDIISEVTGSKTKSYNFTLALDLIITVSIVFSSVLVKFIKCRPLLFSTGFASVAVLAVACTYLFLVSRNLISKDYPWIPIALFIVFFMLVNLACTPMPVAFFGELLPLAHRGFGSAVGGVGLFLVMYLTLQVTPFLLVHCKVYGTFAILGALMAGVLSILYFILPETKDRTLQDIEDFFNERQPKDDVEVQMIDKKNNDESVNTTVCETEENLPLFTAID